MTLLTAHQAVVFYIGLCYFLSGLLILAMCELLGPHYKDHWTLGPKRRFVLFLLGVGAVLRGSTFIFPGKLVATDQISPLLPYWTTIVLVASGTFAELLSSQRAPPPVITRVMLLFRALMRPTPAVNALMASPPADFLGDSLAPADAAERPCGRRLRVVVLVACALGLVSVLVVVLHAAAATLPTR